MQRNHSVSIRENRGGRRKGEKSLIRRLELPAGCGAELCNSRRERRELWVGRAIVGMEPEGSMAPTS